MLVVAQATNGRDKRGAVGGRLGDVRLDGAWTDPDLSRAAPLLGWKFGRLLGETLLLLVDFLVVLVLPTLHLVGVYIVQRLVAGDEDPSLRNVGKTDQVIVEPPVLRSGLRQLGQDILIEDVRCRVLYWDQGDWFRSRAGSWHILGR